MILSVILLILGSLSICYDVILICLCPGTFWDNVFSFTHIWSVLGLYLIFVGIYRIKKGHSFWQIWNKKLKKIFIACVCVGASICIINLSFILNPKIADVKESVDYVILLGGGIDKNGKLPGNVLLRTNKAAEFLLSPEQKNTKVIVTGGTLHWLPYAEAPEIKRQLVERGILENRILVEDKALDTIQNFELSGKMIAQTEGITIEQALSKKIVVVTSNFHLRRAERLASRIGYKNVRGIASPSEPFKYLHNYVKEICSYIKLNLRIIFTKEPQKMY